MKVNQLVLLLWIASVYVQAMEMTKEIQLKIDACHGGDVHACYDAGMALISGKNAEDQEKKNLGLEYIRKACKFGEEKACDVLGENYVKDGHYGAARPYFEASCERGIASACTGLGTIYRDGHDVRQDDVASRKYYEKACDLGDKDACINVAIIYRGGFGVNKDRAMVKKYYKKACEAGSKPGCESFTEMDNEDKGIKAPGLWEKFKSLF